MVALSDEEHGELLALSERRKMTPAETARDVLLLACRGVLRRVKSAEQVEIELALRALELQFHQPGANERSIVVDPTEAL